MDDQAMVLVKHYERPDRLAQVDALAKRKETSRSDLYRRAMREYLLHHDRPQEELSNDHE